MPPDTGAAAQGRTVLRRTAVEGPVTWLIKERSREAGLMLSRYTAWQALGSKMSCSSP
jgi:hypothetical protein